jgi:hypothetical protein
LTCNFLGQCLTTDPSNAVTFCLEGGLAVMQDTCLGLLETFLDKVILQSTYPWKDIFETRTISRALAALSQIFQGYIGCLVREHPPLQTLTTEMNVPVIAQYIHKVLSSSQDPALLRPAVICVANNCTFLIDRFENDAVLREEALDCFLLHGAGALPTTSTSEPIAALMVRWRRHALFSDMKDMMLSSVREGTSNRVLAAVDRELLSEIEGTDTPSAILSMSIPEKLRHCNYPTCYSCSDGLGGPKFLKKCGKCTSVVYCGRARQVADWKEHKKHCEDMRIAKLNL